MRDDDVICHAEYTGGGVGDPDSTFTIRTETLRKFTIAQAIDRRVLEEHGFSVADPVLQDLMEELRRRIEKAGRMVHGEVHAVQSDDPMRDCVWLRLSCSTRESTEGSWPEIHAAVREDQAALSSGEWVED